MKSEKKDKTLPEWKQEQVRMIDMHAHLSCSEAAAELKLREENGIFTCFSAGTPQQWNTLKRIRNGQKRPWGNCPGFLISFGIHPWYAKVHEPGEVYDCLEECDFIGEIGMDSVWCQVPLKVQQDRLERQLQIAADLKKPVILHTKGQEQRIAEIIRDFPGKVCVHWYSGDRKALETFMKQDCYFTLGPDAALPGGQGRQLSEAEEVRLCMVRQIPVNRLFVETDGLEAVAWARGAKHLELSQIVSVLREKMRDTAEKKHLTLEALEKRMIQNLMEFLEV